MCVGDGLLRSKCNISVLVRKRDRVFGYGIVLLWKVEFEGRLCDVV